MDNPQPLLLIHYLILKEGFILQTEKVQFRKGLKWQERIE